MIVYYEFKFILKHSPNIKLLISEHLRFCRLSKETSIVINEKTYKYLHLHKWRILVTIVPRIILHKVKIMAEKDGGRRLEVCQDTTAVVTCVLTYLFRNGTKMTGR